MIHLQKVSKSYSSADGTVHALKNIDLQINSGETVSIIGKSGAGKSTLIRLINLLERPSYGQVYVNHMELTGLNAAALRQARSQIGMIFQHFNLLSSRTVFANVALPLELSHTPKKLIQAKVSELLTLTGLSDKHHVYPHELSGGQRQRVAIARALAASPKVLLCDEATSALDPQTTRSILQLLKDIQQKLQLTLVLITHDLEVVKQISDQVIVLDEGEIVERTTVPNLFLQPQSEAAQKLVGSHQDMTTAAVTADLQPTPDASSASVVRLSLAREQSATIVGKLALQFDILPRIRQAHLEELQQCTFGTLLLELPNSANHPLSDVLHFLHRQDIPTEVLGYVARSA